MLYSSKVAMITDASADHSFTADESFVGGFSLTYPNSTTAKYFFTWPFARISFAKDEICLVPRGPFRLLLSPISIQYHEIDRVDAAMSRMAGTFLLSCTIPEVDGIGFGIWRRSDFNRILDLLRQHEVPVQVHPL